MVDLMLHKDTFFILLSLLSLTFALNIEIFLQEQCNAEFAATCPFKQISCLQDVPHILRAFESIEQPSRYAIFSLNIPFNPEGTKYSYFVGLTAMIWKYHIGFTPLVIFVVEYDDKCSLSPKQSAILKFLKEQVHQVGGLYLVVNYNQSALKASQYRSATIAQVSRIITPFLPFDEQDYILTADADIWPISTQWFLDHVTSAQYNQTHLAILYGNRFQEPVWKQPGEQQRMPMYAICYLGATVRNWRQIVQFVPPQPNEFGQQRDSFFVTRLLSAMANAKEKLPGFDFSYTALASAQWYFDQLMAVQYIDSWKGEKYIKSRNTQSDRIDRSAWPGFPYPTHLVNEIKAQQKFDSHLLRPGDTHENWLRLKSLIDIIFSMSHHSESTKTRIMAWVEKYHTEWTKITNN